MNDEPAPRLLAIGAIALATAGLLGWVMRGPALLLDLIWLGCL
jgi:hypothetical protein